MVTDELLQPSQEAVGEAVAWMYSRPSVHGGMREIVTITRDTMMVEHGWTEIPLYRDPVAADREARGDLLQRMLILRTDPRLGDGQRQTVDDAMDAILVSLSPKGAE